MPSGGEVTRRTLLLLFAPAAGLAIPRSGRDEALDVRLDGPLLRISAPKFHFVTGKPLQRLHDGAPVPFAIQLCIKLDPAASPLYRDIQRFVMSYDLWEQKFSVTRLGPGRRTTSHATAAGAEGWCIGEMAVEPKGIAATQPFWVRLEVRAEDLVNRASPESDSMTLARLIDLFSRRSRGEERLWNAEAGPFRLADLKRGRSAAFRERLGRREEAGAADRVL